MINYSFLRANIEYIVALTQYNNECDFNCDKSKRIKSLTFKNGEKGWNNDREINSEVFTFVNLGQF